MVKKIIVGEGFSGAAMPEQNQQEQGVPSGRPSHTEMVTGYPEKPDNFGPLGKGNRVFIPDDDNGSTPTSQPS